MKQFMLLFTLAFGLLSQAHASRMPDPVEQAILRSLHLKFPGAEFSGVRKIEGEDLYSIRLVYQNEGIMAYANEAGEVTAVVRCMTRSRLPMLVGMRIDRSYEGYEMRQGEELSMGGETSYMFLMQNDREQVTVRVFANGDARVLKRRKLH